MHNLKLSIILFSISLSRIIPAHAAANCTCVAEDEPSDKAGALKYKVAAIPAVLLAGVIGVLFPVLGKIYPSLRPETTFFFLTKAFAAGVILATGFIHVLPEAFEKLTSPCLSDHPWKFPFTGLIAMTAAILTLSIDSFATSFFQKKFGHEGELGAPHMKAHGHSHGVIPADSGDSLAESESKTQLLRHRIVAQVLEVGIIVHSVVIGLTLGASQCPNTAKSLFAALMFHQCFEGLGLGSCIAQGKFKCASITIMALFFSLTTPVGIGVGMGISHVYSETSSTALIVQGVLNSASAGILIYMSLVDLLAPDFMHPKMQADIGLQVMAYIFLLLGAGLMSLLAKWA